MYYHNNFQFISLVRRMWRSTFVPETISRRSIRLELTDRTCWKTQLLQTNLTGPGRLFFHELNSLSLVRLIKSSAFGIGLTRYRVTVFSNTRLTLSGFLLSSSLSVLSLNFKSLFSLQRCFGTKSSKVRTSGSKFLNLGLLCSRSSIIREL